MEQRRSGGSRNRSHRLLAGRGRHVVGTTSVFASDLGTPLPIVFHPNGDLFYATFGGNGRIHVITAQ